MLPQAARVREGLDVRLDLPVAAEPALVLRPVRGRARARGALAVCIALAPLARRHAGSRPGREVAEGSRSGAAESDES